MGRSRAHDLATRLLTRPDSVWSPPPGRYICVLCLNETWHVSADVMARTWVQAIIMGSSAVRVRISKYFVVDCVSRMLRSTPSTVRPTSRRPPPLPPRHGFSLYPPPPERRAIPLPSFFRIPFPSEPPSMLLLWRRQRGFTSSTPHKEGARVRTHRLGSWRGSCTSPLSRTRRSRSPST